MSIIPQVSVYAHTPAKFNPHDTQPNAFPLIYRIQFCLVHQYVIILIHLHNMMMIEYGEL